MLYLESDVTLSNYIQPACLPASSSTSYPGLNVSVFTAGWGNLNSTQATNVLQNVKLITFNSSECPYYGYIDEEKICAGIK